MMALRRKNTSSRATIFMLPDIRKYRKFMSKFLNVTRRWHITTALAFSVVILLSYTAYKRNSAWQNDLKLMTDITNKFPHKSRGYIYLGNYHYFTGSFDNAIINFQTALRLTGKQPELLPGRYVGLAMPMSLRGK